MTIIKLDAAAVAVLFPEGSEQRVELQKAVVAEFSKKAFSARGGLDKSTIESIVNNSLERYHSTLRSSIETAVRKIQNDTLGKAGYVSETEKGSYWDKVKAVTLTPRMVGEIESTAKDVFNSQIKKTVEEHLNKSIELQLSHSVYWQTLIQKKVEEALNSEVLKQVQAALKTKE